MEDFIDFLKEDVCNLIRFTLYLAELCFYVALLVVGAILILTDMGL